MALWMRLGRCAALEKENEIYVCWISSFCNEPVGENFQRPC